MYLSILSLAEFPTVHCGLCVGGSNLLPIRREAAAVLGWAGLGWAGLAWAGLGWTTLALIADY